MKHTIITMLAIILASSAYSMVIGQTELPYKTHIDIEINGTSNSTLNITYGAYVSGPYQVTFTDSTTKTLRADVDVAFMAPGNYTSWVRVGNATYDFVFTISDNAVFEMHSDKDFGFIGEDFLIWFDVPDNTSIQLEIDGKQVPVADSHYIFNPADTGTYTVAADYHWHGSNFSDSMNFTIYRKLACSISIPEKAQENETVFFKPKVSGGTGDYVYRWDFGDGKTSHEASTEHKYLDAGDYDIRLDITDSLNYKTTCRDSITIEPMKYYLEITLKDSVSNKVIGDANVTLDDELKKTNVNGKVTFRDLEKGRYDLEIMKDDYEVYSKTVRIDSNIEMNVSLEKTPEEKMPVPEMDILSPVDGIDMDWGDIVFEFEVSSDTKVSECSLLYNVPEHKGYKVLDTIKDVAREKPQQLHGELTDGDYIWLVMCENEDGTGKSAERNIRINGAPVQEAKEVVEEEPVEKSTADMTIFDELEESMLEFRRKISQSSRTDREVYRILKLNSLVDANIEEVSRLRKEMNNLQGLTVAEADKKRRIAEIYHKLDEMKKATPASIKVTGSRNYEDNSADLDFAAAAETYLEWKNHTLSKRKFEQYVEDCAEAQQSSEILTSAYTVQVNNIDGSIDNYGIIERGADISGVSGGMLFELPSDNTGKLSKMEFSMNYEKITDTVARMDLAENTKYSYFIKNDISMDELSDSKAIVLLDITHPDNMITGFSIMDTAQGTGKYSLIMLLLSVVITGNYLIFFRDKSFRSQLISRVKNMGLKRPQAEITELLDAVIDKINAGRTPDALAGFSRVAELYSKCPKSFQTEIKPIMEHLNYELIVFNLNNDIKKAYSKVIGGKWHEAVGDYNAIQDEFDILPPRFQKKVDKQKLDLTMEIHMLKGTDEQSQVEDDIYSK